MKRTATYAARLADTMSAGWSCDRGSLDRALGFAHALIVVGKPVNLVSTALQGIDASEPGDRVG